METVDLFKSEHYSRGIKLFDSGLYTEAIAEFERVLEADIKEDAPERRLASFYLGESYTTLGIAHLKMRMYHRAEEELQFALMLHPEYADLHFNLAVVYYKKQEYAKAEAELRYALEINPSYARALIYLGLTLLRMDNESGLTEIATAVAIESAYDDDRYENAIVLYRHGEREGAIVLFEEVADTDVDRVRHLLEDGLQFLQAGAYTDALEMFEEAVAVCPHYPDIRNNLGICYAYQGMTKQAIGQFQVAIEINPRFIGAHLNLADAFMKDGKKVRAIAALKRVLKLDPKNLEAERRMSALKQD